jgi:hypothetical protein
MKWKKKLHKKLLKKTARNGILNKTFRKTIRKKHVGIHLAIFTNDYLVLIQDGKKKVESRFSINKIGPYEKVKKGDIILAKRTGGAIVGIFLAGKVTFISNLGNSRVKNIEKKYGRLICTEADPLFWDKRSRARYATLIDIENFAELEPFKCEKRDRSGWSVIKSNNTNE